VLKKREALVILMGGGGGSRRVVVSEGWFEWGVWVKKIIKGAAIGTMQCPHLASKKFGDSFCRGINQRF